MIMCCTDYIYRVGSVGDDAPYECDKKQLFS